MQEAERFLVVDKAGGLDESAELVESVAGFASLAELGAGHRGDGQLQRRVGARVAEALDGFECLRGLTSAVQGQGQGAAVFRQSYRVFGDNLASGFEPSDGQAVVLGLAGRPHDRQPGGLVKRRGIFGAALGDLDRGCPEPRDSRFDRCGASGELRT